MSYFGNICDLAKIKREKILKGNLCVYEFDKNEYWEISLLMNYEFKELK